MGGSLKIAMLIHNAVRNDGRVLKEAETLASRGHEVRLFGISNDGREHRFTITNHDIRVILTPLGISPAVVIDRSIRLIQTKFVQTKKFKYLIAGLLLVVIALTLSLLIALLLTLSGFYPPHFESLAPLIILFFAGALAILVHKKVRSAIFARIEPTRIQRFLNHAFSRFYLQIAGFYLRISLTKSRSNAEEMAFDRRLQDLPAAQQLILLSYRRRAHLLLQALGAEKQPDVVHIHDHVALFASRGIKSKLRVPIVWDAHELYDELAQADEDRLCANQWLLQAFQDVPSKFITISESFAHEYRRKLPELPAAKIVMNATRRDATETGQVYDGRLHDAAGLPRDQKVLLYQGGFAKQRGLEFLIEAGATLKPDWTIVLMGWGPLEPELHILAEKFRRPSESAAVTIIPGVPQSELLHWTMGGTLGAIPYENVGLNHLYCTPNKLWEFPAAGLPILATDLVEIRRTVDRYGVGFLLPRNFVARDISDAVNGLSEQDIEAARQRCETYIDECGWHKFEPRLIEVYRELEYERAFSEHPPRAVS